MRNVRLSPRPSLSFRGGSGNETRLGEGRIFRMLDTLTHLCANRVTVHEYYNALGVKSRASC